MQATIPREGPELARGNKKNLDQDSEVRCLHVATEYLGSGGNMVYRQCTRCGAVILIQAGRAVAIPGRTH